MKTGILKAIVIGAIATGCNSEPARSPEPTENVSENEVKSTTEMKLEIDRVAIVGEGAIWNPFSKKFLWIDIEGKRLFEYDLATKENTEFELPSQPGTVVPVDEKNVILALVDGIYAYNLETRELIKKADNPESWRFNDGKCDAQGRLWVGTLDTDTYSEPVCNLYKVGSDFSVTKMKDSVIISNGITWSADNSKMYYIDSPTRKVTCFDFDLNAGSISNPKTCLDFKEYQGTPDGNTLDEDGNLWVAFWDGGCVLKCNPKTGEVIEKYDVPAHNVTSLAFGGDDLDTLFITTASNDMSDEEKEQFPDAGKVFSFKPGVKGLPANYFQIK